MKTAILGLIIIVAIGVVIAIRRTATKNLRPSNLETHPTANPYHCVAIRHGDEACAAVKRLSDQRLLSKEAPSLPVSGCDVAACRCRYVHFEDRRQGDERRDLQPAVLRVGGYSGRERRSGKERRRVVPHDMNAGAIGG